MTYKHKANYEKQTMINKLNYLKSIDCDVCVCESTVKTVIAKAEDLGLTISWNDGKEATFSQLTISE